MKSTYRKSFREIMIEEKYYDTLEFDEELYCKCGTHIKSESDYEYIFVDGEIAEFICPLCKIKYKVQIDRPIEKVVFLIKEK